MAHYQVSCMPLISNLLVLDAEGKRVAVKYFGETWCASGCTEACQSLHNTGCARRPGRTLRRRRRLRRRCSPRRRASTRAVNVRARAPQPGSLAPGQPCLVRRAVQRLAAGPPDPRARHAATAEIIAFDNVIVVYKFIGDLHFYATADAEENEIILATVLTALTETVSMVLACVPTPCASRTQTQLAQGHASAARARVTPLTFASRSGPAAKWTSAARWRTWTSSS